MLPELSLNILDISQNSISAHAAEIKIEVQIDTVKSRMRIAISDDGDGMDAEAIARVTDPFYTTRTTRKVGLGIPFFKQEAECTGGSFSIASVPGEGTQIQAEFCTDHIDCMPLGDINATIHSLIVMNPTLDICYRYGVNDSSFCLDTTEMRELLGDVPLDAPEVSEFVREYLRENESEINRKEGMYEIIS